MNYRKLGRTGLKVSTLCLGTMQFGWTADESLSHKILDAAFDKGINFIDTADIYSSWVEGNPGGVSETIIGKWLKKNPALRDQVVIATKVRGQMGDGPNNQGLSRAHIFNAVEASLRRLGVETIDLYQTHWPDEATPIDETLTALNDLVQQGKVRWIGSSNYSAGLLMQALGTSEAEGYARFETIQPHYNLLHRSEYEREVASICENHEIGVIPYSPLAGGFLTGKYHQDQPIPDSVRASSAQQKYFNPRGWKVLETVENIAQTHQASISQVALAWLLNDPVITSPIIGPRTLEQLTDNLGAVDLQLSGEEMETLNQVSA
ncbi:MAG: aldo/keto reductase [Chloroflexota bacterium]